MRTTRTTFNLADHVTDNDDIALPERLKSVEGSKLGTEQYYTNDADRLTGQRLK